MEYKFPIVTMKKFIILLYAFCFAIPGFAQNQIDIERVITDLDWKDCNESDVILAFKDNVVKREKEETWDGGEVSSFILKNVKIGDCIADANIIVNKYSRKLIKIGGMTLRDYDWSKGVDEISNELERYFSSFWGKEHTKVIDYDTDLEDVDIVYTDIKCEWPKTYQNDKSSKGSFIIMQRAKVIVICIEPK